MKGNACDLVDHTDIDSIKIGFLRSIRKQICNAFN